MDLDRALENQSVMRALTGLTPEEFRELATTFAEDWQEHTQENWQGQPRQRAAGAGPSGELPNPEKKLFFILIYFRLYHIQAVMGYLFGLNQAQANKWIIRLTPLLQKALERLLARPHREASSLRQVLKKCQDWKLLLDGTDRPIRRPKDPARQKDCYSGRKKRHTIKNLILTERRSVRFLSPTVPGHQADKRLAEPLEQVRFPQPKAVIADSGFEGLELKNATLVLPTKKPKGRQLLDCLKNFNQLKARLRVPIEHVISGIKRCRIVSDVFRHIKQGYDDMVMEICCGLHNFREAQRSGGRATLLPIQLN